MLYLPGMKRHSRRILIIGMALMLALFVAGFARYAVFQSTSPSGNTSAAFFLQVTATPEPQQDQSEIGSTDPIVAMGGVIALIIFIPILARYKYWARPSSQ